MTTIAVLSAGLREPSSTRLLADRLGAAAVAGLAARGRQARVEAVEVRPLARAIADALVTQQVSAPLQAAFDTIAGADALVAVSPAFNGSYSGLFKAFVDVLPEGAVRDLPVLLGATGGTPRHALILEHALRPLFSYLRAITVPTAVYAATEDFGSHGGEGQASLAQRIARAGDELAGLVDRLGPRVAPDVDAEEVDTMARLLAELGR